MLKDVVRFNPNRECERLNNTLLQVWQDKRKMRERKMERQLAEEEMAEAFDVFPKIDGNNDPEELRVAIERAAPLASGAPVIAELFKERKKLKMLEGDLLLQSVTDSEDVNEIKKVLDEVKAVPYVDNSLHIQVKRRHDILEAENKLQAALKSDNADALRVAMCHPALGNCIPGRDLELMCNARQRLTALTQERQEREAAQDQKRQSQQRMRPAFFGSTTSTGPEKTGTRAPETKMGIRSARSLARTGQAMMAVSVQKSVTFHTWQRI